MSWASVVAAGVSLAAAVLLYITFLETRRIGKAQTRAYLACTGGSYIIYSDDYISITVNVANRGQSPARKCTVKVRANLPEILGDGDSERITATPLFSDWQTSKPVPVFLTAEAHPHVIITSLPLKQHNRLHDRTDVLWCEVILEWTDVFGDTQREAFRLTEVDGPRRWNGDVPRSRLGELEAKNAPDERS